VGTLTRHRESLVMLDQTGNLLSRELAVRRVFENDAADAETDRIVPDSENSWPISRPTARLVARFVRELKLTSVLEFGAGRSSIVLATAMAHVGGGRLTSIEHQPEFSRESWHQVEQVNSVDSCLVASRLRLMLSKQGLTYGFPDASGLIAARAPFDLVFIDSPPGTYGRDAPLWQAYPHLKAGAVVVLDDAERAAEQTTTKRWLKLFPGLQLCVLDTSYGRGVAVFVHSGDKRSRFTPRVFLGTIHDRWVSSHVRLRGA
jgi:predicted O-methyltransferase YrrM